MKKTLSPATSTAILEAAWRLIVERGRADVSLAEIAAAAGVTRQSIYLGFGGRSALLVAMARNADQKSEHSRRLRAIAESGADEPEALSAFVSAWLAHLPEIYPVGVLLAAAAVTDPDAAIAFNDRMIGSPHARYRQILGRLASAGHVASGWDADRGADLCWSLTHIDAWRQLVVERGWTPQRFETDRQTLIRHTLIARLSGSDSAGRSRRR